MAVTIRLLPSQADDLAAVCAMGQSVLDRVERAILDAPVTIKRDRLREIVQGVLQQPQAETLCRLIFGLAAVESHKATLIPNTIAGISNALEARYPNDKRFLNWGVISQPLLRILQCQSVYFAAKAVDVSYDFERVLTGSRIITSVRPVYSDERDAVVGITVVQTLRLDYVDGSGHSNSISIALDLADVSRLQCICLEASEKARIAKAKFGEPSLEVLMAGEGAV